MIAFTYCKKNMGFVNNVETKEHSGNCFSSPSALNNQNKQTIISAIPTSARPNRQYCYQNEI